MFTTLACRDILTAGSTIPVPLEFLRENMCKVAEPYRNKCHLGPLLLLSKPHVDV